MLGNGYGWVAALLILLNLSYLIRRRYGGARMGSMAVWLDIHVFTGLLIASLVSFHSSFQLRTPIATTSTISLAVVVITGVLGRLLHFLAPANTRVLLEAAIDSFEAEFPTPGAYRLFLQFRHDDRVRTAAFTVDVTEETR